MRIPWLITLERVSDPSEVSDLARSGMLDRRFEHGNGLISRWIAERPVRLLSLDGTRFPSMAPKDDPTRAEAQKRLHESLAGQSPDRILVQETREYLLGHRTEAEIETAIQGAIGRLFRPDFIADSESRADAALLNAAPREFNPLRLVRTRLTGDVTSARDRLSTSVGGDVVAMHGISIALHSLCASFAELKRLAKTPGAFDYLDASEAVQRALRPPETILRQAESNVRLGAREIPKGALCVVNLRDAYDRAIDSGQGADELGFMEAGWSYCPASQWVRSVLTEAWTEARDATDPRPAALEQETASARFSAHLLAQRTRAETTFRRLWRLRLALDLGLGLLALVAADWIGARLFDLGEATALQGFVRLWGLMLIGMVLFSAPTWISVSKWRWPILAGLALRPAFGLAYVALGGVWLGLFELVFWLVLIFAYYKLGVATLQSHP